MGYKRYRQAWVETIYAQAVELFHQARRESGNADVPLPDLARQCANTAFQENAETIVGDKEVTAKEFMAHCRHNFGAEVSTAIAERAQVDIEKRQFEEKRAMVN